jgi:hypothetical protein
VLLHYMNLICFQKMKNINQLNGLYNFYIFTIVSIYLNGFQHCSFTENVQAMPLCWLMHVTKLVLYKFKYLYFYFSDWQLKYFIKIQDEVIKRQLNIFLTKFSSLCIQLFIVNYHFSFIVCTQMCILFVCLFHFTPFSTVFQLYRRVVS